MIGRMIAPVLLASALAAWVHGTEDPPLQALLQDTGVQWQIEPPTLAQRWGLRVSESTFAGVKVKAVLRGGIAERAGLAAGDELLAVNAWRLRNLEEAKAYLAAERTARLLISRDQRVVSLVMSLEADEGSGSVLLTPTAKPSTSALAIRKLWAAA